MLMASRWDVERTSDRECLVGSDGVDELAITLCPVTTLAA